MVGSCISRSPINTIPDSLNVVIRKRSYSKTLGLLSQQAMICYRMMKPSWSSFRSGWNQSEISHNMKRHPGVLNEYVVDHVEEGPNWTVNAWADGLAIEVSVDKPQSLWTILPMSKSLILKSFFCLEETSQPKGHPEYDKCSTHEAWSSHPAPSK